MRFLGKTHTDRMNQGGFTNSGRAVYPVSGASVVLAGLVGDPGYDSIEESLAGATHIAEVPVIAGLEGFRSPKRKLSLYPLVLYDTNENEILRQ